MALSISNNLNTPSLGMGTQTSTPAIPKKGNSIFDLLGLSRGMGFGAKPLFPNTTSPSTSVQQPVTTSTAGLMSSGGSNKSSSAQDGIAGYYYDQPIHSGQDVATQIAAIDASRNAPAEKTSSTKTTKSTTTKGLVSPTVPTYGGMVSGLVDASTTSKAQTDLLKRLAAAGEGNVQLGQNAQNIANQYAPEIARVGQLGAGAQAGFGSTGSNVVGEGNAAIASANASQRMQALAAGETAQLAGNEQQLSAQSQLQGALGTALGGANTQQAQTISGLGTAAGLGQPSTASYGQTVFDPLTGTYSGGQGNLDPATAATQLAQQVTSGKMTYDQAVASLGYAGGAGQQFLNQALQGTGYNIPQGQATLTGQTGVIAQLPFMESANTAAEGIKSKITTYLASNPQLNPADLAVGNKLQQWVQGKQLTDPKYQTLFNYLNEYTNTLAPILGVGGDPTNLKTQIAQSFVNAAASGQSIATVLDNMSTLASGKIQDLRSGATGGGVVSSPVTGSGTGSGGLYGW